MALSRDDRLVARARAGDDAAFEALYARHQPAILAFCRHLTGNREDAEDAVQHTFLAAYRQLAAGGEEVELRPWLYTVARNRCLSLLRARRERLVAEPDSAARAFDGLTAEVERRQELRDLVRDLARLPEPQRAALVLSQLDALSYREIGTVLGVEAAKVKALVFQARSSLASAREARDTPCLDVRQELATARGASLRRRLLRRHVGQCDSCREFEVAVRRQRTNLGSLLPVVPSTGLAAAVLGSDHGREGAAAAAGAGGTAAVAGGGGGMLAALGGAGLAKLAVVAVVAGGGVAGAVAAEVPQRVVGESPAGTSADRGGDLGNDGDGSAGAPSPSSDDAPDDGPSGAGPVGRDRDDRGARAGADDAQEGPVSEAGVDAGELDDPARGPGDGEAGGGNAATGGPDAGLPPGLAKRDELPPGLAKRDELPPGLAKRGESGVKPQGSPTGGPSGQRGGGGGGRDAGPPSTPSGQSGGGGQGGNGGSPAGGNGNGGGNAGNANGQGNGAQGGAGGQQGAGKGQANGNGNQPG